VTGDDHNTDALIAALRSPALPAERAGEAAAVTAMLGVIARAPASTRFRAGRGIAIAVVTVASLGVGGLAAAGPGVFQAAASKARSFVTDDSAETSADAGAANSGDPLSGSLLDDASGVDTSAAGLALAAQQAATAGASPAGAATPTAPPPECADGNHGDAVAVVANSSVPPSAEQDHEAVTDAARDACTPQGPQGDGVPGGTNPNQPEDTPEGPPISTPAHEPATPPEHTPPVTGPPVTTPPRPPTGPPISTPGSGNGQGTGNGDQGGQGAGPGADGGKGQSSTPAASVPPDNGKANPKGDGG
jgi:hypothetical protein